MNYWDDFVGRLSNILKKDTRYKEESYLFVMSALNRVLRSLMKPRHITAEELLDGIQSEAKDQFGPMAATVLDFWGIKNSLDFGHIVFNMVQEGILSKSEQDALRDFQDHDFFQKLFDVESEYRLRKKEVALKTGKK